MFKDFFQMDMALQFGFGFMIQPTKSFLTSKQNIIFLGFDVDSWNVTITLRKDKTEKIKRLSEKLLKSHKIRQRELRSIIFNIVSSFIAIAYGPIYYRSLEKD